MAHSPEMLQLLTELPLHRLHHNNEAGLQALLAQVLTTLGLEFEREYSLGKCGRIDFYLPKPRLGIEVKVDGSPAAVKRQVEGYAEHPDIAELLLVSTRAKHRGLPGTMNGKPVACVGFAAGWM